MTPNRAHKVAPPSGYVKGLACLTKFPTPPLGVCAWSFLKGLQMLNSAMFLRPGEEVPQAGHLPYPAGPLPHCYTTVKECYTTGGHPPCVCTIFQKAWLRVSP